MSTAIDVKDLDELRATVTRQGALVKQLKKDGAPQVRLTFASPVLFYPTSDARDCCLRPGNAIRRSLAPQPEVAAAVDELKRLKQQLEEATKAQAEVRPDAVFLCRRIASHRTRYGPPCPRAAARQCTNNYKQRVQLGWSGY